MRVASRHERQRRVLRHDLRHHVCGAAPVLEAMQALVDHRVNHLAPSWQPTWQAAYISCV